MTGIAAPLCIHALINSPKSCCVPGAAARPSPGCHAQPTSRIFRYVLVDGFERASTVRAGSLICSQISASDRPCHAIEAGASINEDGLCIEPTDGR